MTLTLRSRLTLLYTALFVVLLAVIAAVSYRVLAYQLDADVSASLTEVTTGLHGYLRFPNDLPIVVFDQTDAAQAAFAEEATRYYQIFDARTGELIVQSDALRPLGLEFTPAEVRQFRERPTTLDLNTDYGRIRLHRDRSSRGRSHRDADRRLRGHSTGGTRGGEEGSDQQHGQGATNARDQGCREVGGRLDAGHHAAREEARGHDLHDEREYAQKGAVAVGSPVSVRYQESGTTHVATAVSLEQAKTKSSAKK